MQCLLGNLTAAELMVVTAFRDTSLLSTWLTDTWGFKGYLWISLFSLHYLFTILKENVSTWTWAEPEPAAGSVHRIRTNLNTEPDPGSVSQTVLQPRAARPAVGQTLLWPSAVLSLPVSCVLSCFLSSSVVSCVLFCFLWSVFCPILSFYFLSHCFLSSGLAAPSLSCYFLSSIVSRVIVSLVLADNSSPRSLHHVRLAGERPGTHWPASHQEPNTSLFPSHPVVFLRPSMHPARRWQQPDIRVCVGHRVAPHTAGLLQVGLALLLHQRSERRRVGGVVMLRDGDLRLGLVA